MILLQRVVIEMSIYICVWTGVVAFVPSSISYTSLTPPLISPYVYTPLNIWGFRKAPLQREDRQEKRNGFPLQLFSLLPFYLSLSLSFKK